MREKNTSAEKIPGLSGKSERNDFQACDEFDELELSNVVLKAPLVSHQAWGKALIIGHDQEDFCL